MLKFLNESTNSYLPSAVRPEARSDLFVFVLSELTNMPQSLNKNINYQKELKGRLSNNKDQMLIINKHKAKKVKTL